MWEKLKQVHYMFHIALVFIIFPVAGVLQRGLTNIILF